MEATTFTSSEARSTSTSVPRKRIFFNRQFWMKLAVFASLFLFVVDTVYRSYNGITYLSRGKCILYGTLPRWAFLLYENIIELLVVVIIAIFAATLLEKYFSRAKRFIPKHPLGAFLYASLIPACSCSAVPMIRTMHGKIPFRTIVTFVVAAPLLNPYIIMMSMTVLGFTYGILRILCSLVLAVTTGYIAEFFQRDMTAEDIPLVNGCGGKSHCPKDGGTLYEETFAVLKKIAPFLIAAGLLGIAIELLAPSHVLHKYDLGSNPLGTLAVILIGVPIYFCNGADVLFLQPLMHYSSLPLGTAMAFSLTSTSICITSLLLLFKYVGKKLTGIILVSVIVITFVLAFSIQFVPRWFF